MTPGKLRGACLAVSLAAASLGAQQAPRALWRLDAVAGNLASLQLGVGMHAMASTYVRTEVTLGAGVLRRADAWRLAGRVDATGRFVIDPIAESARAVYALGGIAAMYDGADWSPRLLVGVGLEGRPRGSVRWSTEAVLGGGLRLGFVARRTRPNRR